MLPFIELQEDYELKLSRRANGWNVKDGNLNFAISSWSDQQSAPGHALAVWNFPPPDGNCVIGQIFRYCPSSDVHVHCCRSDCWKMTFAVTKEPGKRQAESAARTLTVQLIPFATTLASVSAYQIMLKSVNHVGKSSPKFMPQ
ncbi:hypothetical protein M514_28129 [Trichuris suis]|uniref:Uncharacterized protein n=1 Tax=Trichuris suis TaxID=68888 RepID=A0A085MR49_9BILA|nr:hypothetical protein M514_28129 [Trichuris suis]